MADKQALQTELAELYAARAKLLTGSMRESISFGDRRVQYTAASMNRLEARIRTIEGQLGINSGRRRRAIGVSY
ncbi:MAG TPA: gpW family head-tail joining protein [Wenzhouxiangella sp.]|nr:gpW family head-tail joining protein [Wenzhouxiangella sp.]